MFGVPIEKIKKGNPEYALRQRGKVGELALGYQGGSGALITMGALKMGIPEEDLPDIVSRWRKSNQRIVELWYKVENAAVSRIQTGKQEGVNNLIFSREFDLANNLKPSKFGHWRLSKSRYSAHQCSTSVYNTKALDWFKAHSDLLD